jgi:CheY-like chemotaxis protein
MNQAFKIILLADDDLDDQELLEEAFLHIEPEAEIHTVLSGKILIEYLPNCLNKHLPCLIVFDYNMPGMNAPEILDDLCENEL